jgi:ribonuclease HI
MARNNARFLDKATNWRNAISWISANSALAGNNTSLCSNSSMSDFKFLKQFNINIHPPKAPNIKEVIWMPPLVDWVKCNCDGASTQLSSACGGIYRNHLAEFICCFAENTGTNSAYFAELCGAMRAIEIAADNGWRNVWLETDSSLVVLAFRTTSLVPWKIRNRWNNCMHTITTMNFLISHIYREGNGCADTLANIGLTLVHPIFWNDLPQAIFECFSSDRLGRAKYRFVNT